MIAEESVVDEVTARRAPWSRVLQLVVNELTAEQLQRVRAKWERMTAPAATRTPRRRVPVRCARGGVAVPVAPILRVDLSGLDRRTHGRN